MYVPEMKSSGNKTSCTTASAASELADQRGYRDAESAEAGRAEDQRERQRGPVRRQRDPEETADAGDERDIHGADHDAVR
jgi:hypothetical protein